MKDIYCSCMVCKSRRGCLLRHLRRMRMLSKVLRNAFYHHTWITNDLQAPSTPAIMHFLPESEDVAYSQSLYRPPDSIPSYSCNVATSDPLPISPIIPNHGQKNTTVTFACSRIPSSTPYPPSQLCCGIAPAVVQRRNDVPNSGRNHPVRSRFWSDPKSRRRASLLEPSLQASTPPTSPKPGPLAPQA